MEIKSNEEWTNWIEKAVAGDKEALEQIVLNLQDMVFNLSLRMLGTFPDAEDAAQDILLKVITHLATFRGESAFTTWVFRIATNHLIHYKKHMFAQMPLSFEYYGADIENARLDEVPDLTQNVERSILAEELKMSCTNVLLQCLDAESRCIFVLGTMFKLDSRIAGEILDMTPEAYRKRLSRIRRKVADFLSAYCGEYGEGQCHCMKRVDYAIQSHRLNPAALDYTTATEHTPEQMRQFKNAMEEIDDLSARFAFCKTYQSPERTRQFFREFLASASLSAVTNA
ncbi:RNA polymerase sigma factor [Clostridium sp. AF18-27]|uniref:RNA polymerase sigma factor n=1 Tax=Enterocloster lavalensis TaxID=460384 RepID=UPI000E512A8E|nr:RNA polymerase sigma factor [Enterocloster lavalensis]RHR51414.1 RNA polymerase sigma factor [Clostridium sp. AF18-27]